MWQGGEGGPKILNFRGRHWWKPPGSICLLVQLLDSSIAEPLSGLDCTSQLASVQGCVARRWDLFEARVCKGVSRTSMNFKTRLSSEEPNFLDFHPIFIGQVWQPPQPAPFFAESMQGCMNIWGAVSVPYAGWICRTPAENLVPVPRRERIQIKMQSRNLSELF